MLLIEFGSGAVPQDWSCLLFMTKCIVLIARHVVRAHESGLFELEHSSWANSSQFSVAVIELLAQACEMAAGVLLAYVNTLQDG